MVKKLISFFLSLILILSLLSACSSNKDTSKVLIAKVGDREIYLDEFLQGLDYWLSYYNIDASDSSSKSYIDLIAQSHFDSLILSEVALEKGEELGFFNLADEEEKQVEESVSSDMESGRTSVEKSVSSEHPDVSESELEMLVNVELIKEGYVEEDLKKYYTESIVYNKVYDYYTKDITVTDDDVRNEYDSRVESTKSTYASDPSSFESDYLNGNTIYYTPAGFRRVKHILVAFDSATSTEISNLSDSGDTAALQKKLDEALAGIKDKAQGLLDSIQAGTSTFDDVMNNSSDDTTGLSYYPDGYVVGEDSISYDANFVSAVFALQNVGDVSGLVGTTSGYHIIRLEEIFPEGAAAYDNVKDVISSDLLSTKKDDEFYDLALSWKEEMSIKEYPGKYENYLKEYYPSSEVSSESPEPTQSMQTSDSAAPSASVEASAGA